MKPEETSGTEFEGYTKRQEKIARAVVTGIFGVAAAGAMLWGGRLGASALAAGVPYYLLGKATLPAAFVGSVCFKLAYHAWTGKEYQDVNKMPSAQELKQNSDDMKATIASLEQQVELLSKNVENKIEAPTLSR